MTSGFPADTVVRDIDVSAGVRPRGARSLLRQRLTELQVQLIGDGEVRHAVVLVRAREGLDPSRWWTAVRSECCALHARVELSTGAPLSVTAVLIDADTPGDLVQARIRAFVRTDADGPRVVEWRDIGSCGIAAAAAAQTV